MIPVIGQDNLGLGPAGIGLLASADGIGAFCGAIAIALSVKPPHFARLFIGGWRYIFRCCRSSRW
jgi:hypothetical protein